MAQLKRYNGTSWETVGGVVTGDTLPIGSEVDYNGASVPAGWEEVDNDLVVDSIRTKNMFDGIMEQGSYAYADGSKSASSNYVRSSNKISVEAGKTYTLSYTSSIANNSGFVFFNNGTYVSSQNSGTTVTIPSGANQVVFNLGAWPNNITPSDVSNIQFEEGNTATTYTPHQNLNPYSNTYSTSETRIGTWIDGKPLYRKVVYISSLPNNSTGFYDIFSSSEINNIDICFMDDSASFMTVTASSVTENDSMNWIYSTSAFVFTCVRDKKIRIITKDDKSSTSAYVSVKYTKITD